MYVQGGRPEKSLGDVWPNCKADTWEMSGGPLTIAPAVVIAVRMLGIEILSAQQQVMRIALQNTAFVGMEGKVAIVHRAELPPGAAAEHAVIGKTTSGGTLRRGARVTCLLQGG